MIKFREIVPSVYTNASRDFQYISWLIDIVLNSVKHNVDDLYDLPNTRADAKLTELLAMTLGFKVKRNYDQKQLTALVAALPRILKYKGTKDAIEMAGRALIAATGSKGSITCTTEENELIVVIPKTLVDISLFTDLLPYILPAGMTCHIKRTDMGRYTVEDPIELGYDQIVIAKLIPALTVTNNKEITGLATMYNVQNTAAQFSDTTFANYTKNANDDYDVNFGLLNNTMIASLENLNLSEPFKDVQDTSSQTNTQTIDNEPNTTGIINED